MYIQYIHVVDKSFRVNNVVVDEQEQIVVFVLLLNADLTSLLIHCLLFLFPFSVFWGMYIFISVVSLVLEANHISSVLVDAFNLLNSCWYGCSSSLSWSYLALRYCHTLYGRILFCIGLRPDSMITDSWSEILGSILTWFTNVSLLVKRGLGCLLEFLLYVLVLG